MRPERLFLTGFTTFRELAEPIDFTDADLFALTGPTGSGKTSILDAMCFALYGRIPRLDARSVEPVISLGRTEARVLLEFSVEGRAYTAARVVRRTRAGATTAEARLVERLVGIGEERALANGADEVTGAVESLLGLSFDHFTKAVLLPQGAFAAFLHDKPRDRQDLLRSLLDLGIYERMRTLALGRKGAAEAVSAALAETISRLSEATEESEKAAAVVVERRRSVLEWLRETAPRRQELVAALEQAMQSERKLTDEIQVLRAVRRPAEVDEIGRRIAGASEALAAVERDRSAAAERVESIEKELAELPPSVDLALAAQRIVDRDDLASRLSNGEGVTAAAASDLDGARARADAARAGLRDTAAELDRLRREHAAHRLASSIELGEPCPVCLQTVDEAPVHPEPGGIADAESALVAVQAESADSEAALVAAESHHASCQARLADLRDRLAGLQAAVDAGPGREEIAVLVERVEALGGDLEAARKDERARRAAIETARTRLESARAGETEGRRALLAVRDRLTGPPDLTLEDLSADWGTLEGWAAQRLEKAAGEVAEVASVRAKTESEIDALHSEVEARLTAEGLGGREDAIERAARGLAESEAVVARIAEDRRVVAETGQRLTAAKSEAAVAASLTRHLQANGFEGWLMEEALTALVEGANTRLSDLSEGAYSLQLSKREFVIIDHRNADETRGVKTLSGGETFLVSLALALALAEHIGAVAADGTPRLESVFLDEGFGTLDAETLEVVAAVIQELGSRGRMVGIVTHVRELAEMVPTRFEVTKGPGGSTVRRLEV
ncbi:MAG: SMC family ATPase [Acidimicrobiia bacterium]|nr:SMC family ATPase [Acidimicrobiia bacterium]MDH5294397.1 SMC family ATPase [Acidimicrobiia bacterium]